MRRTTTAVLALLLAVSAVAAVPAGVVAQETTTTTGGTATPTDDGASTNTSTTTATDEADDNASIPLGARLDGIIGIQEAELETELEGRAFGLSIAAANSNASKAAVVAEQYGDLEQRLRNLTERKRALREARQNGSMSEGQFRAEMAELHARTQGVRALANQTENVTRGLPEEVLRSKGINVTAIQTLQNNASELTGPEVAEIARGIAGPSVGTAAGGPMAGAGSGARGPPEDAPTNRSGGPDSRSEAGSTDATTARGDAPTTAPDGNETATDGGADAGPGSGSAGSSSGGGGSGSGNRGSGGNR